MERLRKSPETYATKIAFIETRMGENAHLKIPKGMKAESWVRTVDVGLLYAMNPDLTSEQIGELYGKSRVWTDQKSKQFIENLEKNRPKYSQKEFSLPVVLLGKPRSQMCKDRQAVVSTKIREAVVRGITDPEQIAIETKLSLKQIKTADKRRGLGIDFPKKNNSHKQIEDMVGQIILSGKSVDEKLQALLDNSPDNSLKGFFNRGKNNKDPIFCTVGSILSKFGYRAKFAKDVLRETKEHGIPGKIIKSKLKKSKYPMIYYVVYAKDKRRIEDVIREMEIKEKLIKTDIRMICGQLWGIEHAPTSFEIQSDRFLGILGLIHTITGECLNGKMKIDVQKYLKDCPIPVFLYRGSCRISKAREEQFRSFVERRQKEITSKKAGVSAGKTVFDFRQLNG